MKKQQPDKTAADNGRTTSQDTDIQKNPAATPHKRRFSRWMSVPLRVLGCLLLLILLIPLLLYIPPLQTGLKDAAAKIVRDKTGMDIEIDRFRLRFPLRVSLQGVRVIEAGGDTMVNAGELLADVRMLPLLRGDIRLNALQLTKGYYRFLSPDSSMLIKIRAGHLEADNQSSMNLTQSRIMLNKVRLSDGDVSLYMNVWRQKPTPPDSTSTPFYISLNQADITNMRFAMSMLPTIDTLTLIAGEMKLRNGVVDLRNNDITARLLSIDGGDARYIAPTPEYVAAHPAPATDTVGSTPSAPMTIRGDSISLSGFKALYAIKGATPLPGFDANYIEVKDVGIGMRHFYNQASALRLPLTRLSATERSGLQIVEGSGLVALDESGLQLDALEVQTLYSKATVTAGLPFALMQLEPSAPVNATLTASIGMPDATSFMPMLGQYASAFASRQLNARMEAHGTLSDVEVKAMDMAMPGVFSLRAKGKARNALDIKRLEASLTLDGEVNDPSPIERLAGQLPFSMPPLKVKGTLGADSQTYSADVSMVTPRGALLADGHVGLTSERYDATLEVSDLDVACFMPDMGIGKVSARIHAAGNGFNPTLPKAATDFDAAISSISYKGHLLRAVTLGGTLADGRYSIDIDSPNEDINLNAHIVGSLKPDNYCAEGLLRIYNADLMALGLMDQTCRGSADLEFDINARPSAWLYDATLDFHSIAWHMETFDLDLPDGIRADFISESDNVRCALEARGTEVAFTSTTGLKNVTDGLTRAIDVASRQIAARNLDVEEMQELLPPFRLYARASGRGLLRDLLSPSGLAVDTVSLALANDSIIHGGVMARRVDTGSLRLDTLMLGLRERGKLIDYRFHMGNRPGTLDEFAKVNVNGYLGSNRISAFINQMNLAGKTGYRIGFTAAMADSTVSIHFTPLRSTIAYMPWTFNDDNHVDYDFSTMRLNANLRASSRESSLLLMTENTPDGGEDLHLNISNIHVEDFLHMSVMAPPVKATLDGDVRVYYNGKTLSGKGNIGVSDFIYDKMVVGDFDLGLNAGVDLHGESVVQAALKIDGNPAVSLTSTLAHNGESLESKDLSLELTRFPLKVANAFLGKDVASLSGELNGRMDVSGKLSQPLLNGNLSLDSVGVFLPIMGGSLKFRGEPITVSDNHLAINSLAVYGANNNPLTITGAVDATSFSDIAFNLAANASNFMLINNDRRARSDLYGKVAFNLDATVRGPMKHFDVNANLDILGSTNATYSVDMAPTSSLVSTSEGVVKFVNFSDTTQTVKTDSIRTMTAMRITAGLTVTPGAQLTVMLGDNGKVQLHPSGTVNFFRNFMGDMTLNGQLFLGNGVANYKLPVMGQKEFTFNPQSYITFNGDMMNPTLGIKATDLIKANVINSSGNSSLVNFIVGLDISRTLSNPKVVFDLSTDDDLALQNELQSMSADQRSTQAMNLLITGMYQGAGLKTNNGNMADNMLYGLIEQQLNSLASKAVRGVDLSFGIDNYDKSVDGVSSNAMSYSYQVSKSLFDNRFKIVVGGNYATDASADENFSQNLISDISFEYTLKQTNMLTMLVRLFRHTGFESVLEGDVTETGVGFAMRRRLADLRHLFNVKWGKNSSQPSAAPVAAPGTVPSDSAAIKPEEVREVREKMRQRPDTLQNKTTTGKKDDDK